jgi:hypothetical protein
MTSPGIRRRSLLACLLTIPYLAVAGEVTYRFTDGYQLTSPRLKHRASVFARATQPDPDTLELLNSVTFDRTVSQKWFFQPPSPMNEPRAPELDARDKVNAVNGAENYIWNDYYLKHPDTALINLLKRFNVKDVFAFHAYDNSVYPHYRLTPNVNANLGTTNSFGWLTSEVTFRKPPNTVRIGILGDSTSHSTYGRYLQAFLNSWGAVHAKGIKFEVLNAARQALDLTDLISVLRYELGPMGLDYVYLYQGPLIPTYDLVKLPPNVAYGSPVYPPNHIADAAKRILGPLLPWSALASHIVANLRDELPSSELHEPSKPRVRITLPPGVNERAPTVESARKIAYLDKKLSGFDRYKQVADELGVTPLVSTERLYVQDGMTLMNKPNRALYDTLNGPLFWPLSYRDLRRILDFHNRVIAAWAKENRVPLVDIDGRMPLRPELYGDGFHDLDLGRQLRAWVIFQSLLPLIRHDLQTGRIPRLMPGQGEKHPYLSAPWYRINFDALMSAIKAGKAADAKLENDGRSLATMKPMASSAAR